MQGFVIVLSPPRFAGSIMEKTKEQRKVRHSLQDRGNEPKGCPLEQATSWKDKSTQRHT